MWGYLTLNLSPSLSAKILMLCVDFFFILNFHKEDDWLEFYISSSLQWSVALSLYSKTFFILNFQREDDWSEFYVSSSL